MGFQIGSHLVGKAQEAYAALSLEESRDYERVKGLKIVTGNSKTCPSKILLANIVPRCCQVLSMLCRMSKGYW